MKKTVFISIVIVVILAVLSVFVFLHGGEKENDIDVTEVDELNSRLHAIANEQQELRDELNELSIAMKSEVSPFGTLTVLFTALEPFVYDDAYPLLEQNKFVAALGLSPKSLPGTEGCMTRSEFNELTEKGWSTALIYDGETPLGDWLSLMKGLLNRYGIDMPSSIYFPRDTYASDLEAELSGYNIEIIIHHGEEKLPLVSTEPGNDFFYLGSIGWRSVNAPSRLKTTVNLGGSVVFVAGSQLEAEVYSSDLFSSMMNTLSGYTEAKTLLVTDPGGALDYRLTVKESEELSSEAYQGRKDDIERRIEDLEKKRRALVGEHMQNLEGAE